MPVKKKEKPLTVDSIKKALLPSIAELFETHSVRTDEKLNAVHQEMHGMKILMEQMDKKIDTALELTTTTTNNAITVSRKQILEPEVVDLNSVITGMENLLRPTIGEDISFHTSLDPKLTSVKVDPGQMEQVIMNLVVNARDAMPKGGSLTIQTSEVSLNEQSPEYPIAKPGHYIMLSVTDTGCGMDFQTQKRIFEPFFTTKGPTKGTGLGLATVYGIVKQSLGYTFVYSKLNEGTTFKIFLSPFIEATKREEKVSETRNKLTDHGDKTVLLVEDDDDLREILTHALEGRGFHVLKPVTPEEAISIVKQYSGEIHVVITDVVMPQKSGPEIAKEIRVLRPEIQVLFISGYLDDRLEQFGIKSQGIHCLQKPFSSEVLISRVEKILQSKVNQL